MTRENLKAASPSAHNRAFDKNSNAKSQKESSLFWNPGNTMEFLNDPEIAKCMLQILTKQPDLILDEVETDKPVIVDPYRTIFTLYGSSQNKNAVFDLELVRKGTKSLQQTTREAEGHRTLLNLSANRPMFTPTTIYDQEKKEFVSNPNKGLPETYTLYLMEEDLWEDGLPTHEINFVLRGYPPKDTPPITLDEDAHLILLNGTYEDSESDFGKLMHDLRSASSDQMLLPEMKAIARSIEEKAKKQKN